MKYLLISLFIFMCSSFDASARGKLPFCSDCEYITTTHDLPENDNYRADTGEYLELGYFYKQFWILWIPLWNSDGVYCLTDATEETIYEITPEELELIVEEEGITLADNPIPFWDKIGGKILVLLIIGVIIFMKVKGDDEEIQPQAETSEKEV